MRIVRLAAVGDICPGDHYFSLGHGAGSLSREQRGWALRSLSPTLRSADIAVCNLEGVLSPDSNTQDPVERCVFRGPTGWAISLREAGFTAVSIANNHALQHGEEAFWATVRACREAGLDVIGLADGNGQPKPVCHHFGDTRIVLLGVSFVPDSRRSSTPTYASPTLESLLQQIRILAADGACVVVSVHAGTEGLLLPDAETMRMIAALSVAGARLLLIHHSHVFQPVFEHGATFVASGLGNCLFDLHWHPALTKAAALVADIPSRGPILGTLLPFRLTRGMELRLLSGRPEAQFLRALAKRRVKLLEKGPSERDQLHLLQIRKALYFLSILSKGDWRLKLQFLRAKAQRLLGKPA